MWANPDTNSYADRQPVSNVYSNCNTYCYSHTDTDTNSYSHAHRYANGNTYRKPKLHAEFVPGAHRLC